MSHARQHARTLASLDDSCASCLHMHASVRTTALNQLAAHTSCKRSYSVAGFLRDRGPRRYWAMSDMSAPAADFPENGYRSILFKLIPRFEAGCVTLDGCHRRVAMTGRNWLDCVNGHPPCARPVIAADDQRANRAPDFWPNHISHSKDRVCWGGNYSLTGAKEVFSPTAAFLADYPVQDALRIGYLICQRQVHIARPGSSCGTITAPCAFLIDAE